MLNLLAWMFAAQPPICRRKSQKCHYVAVDVVSLNLEQLVVRLIVSPGLLGDLQACTKYAPERFLFSASWSHEAVARHYTYSHGFEKLLKCAGR